MERRTDRKDMACGVRRRPLPTGARRATRSAEPRRNGRSAIRARRAGRMRAAGPGRRRRPPLFGQPRDHAGTVLRRPVLAHLPLAFEPGDRERKTDDPLQHALHEVLRRVADRPGCGSDALLPVGQAGDDFAQPHRVVEELDRTIGMDRDVVPGRDHFAGLALGVVPGRGDVGVRPLEDRQRLADRTARLRVGPCDMAEQGTVRRRSGSSSSGTWLAISPSWSSVTSVARPDARIASCNTSMRSSLNNGGTYTRRLRALGGLDQCHIMD